MLSRQKVILASLISPTLRDLRKSTVSALTESADLALRITPKLGSVLVLRIYFYTGSLRPQFTLPPTHRGRLGSLLINERFSGVELKHHRLVIHFF